MMDKKKFELKLKKNYHGDGRLYEILLYCEPNSGHGWKPIARFYPEFTDAEKNAERIVELWNLSLLPQAEPEKFEKPNKGIIKDMPEWGSPKGMPKGWRNRILKGATEPVCSVCKGTGQIVQEISEYRTPNVDPCPKCQSPDLVEQEDDFTHYYNAVIRLTDKCRKLEADVQEARKQVLKPYLHTSQTVYRGWDGSDYRKLTIPIDEDEYQSLSKT